MYGRDSGTRATVQVRVQAWVLCGERKTLNSVRKFSGEGSNPALFIDAAKRSNTVKAAFAIRLNILHEGIKLVCIVRDMFNWVAQFLGALDIAACLGTV